MNPAERLKQWAGRSWWRWSLIALPFVLLGVIGVALWPKGQPPQALDSNAQIDDQADRQLNDIEQKRQQAANVVRDELKKRQGQLLQRSQNAPAGELRDELLQGATSDD
ncbi:MAG: hypothetical protein H6727_09315 [Myxococcales bacterium]|nr:hypothetical protein [Myxococcales bacterium]